MIGMIVGMLNEPAIMGALITAICMAIKANIIIVRYPGSRSIKNGKRRFFTVSLLLISLVAGLIVVPILPEGYPVWAFCSGAFMAVISSVMSFLFVFDKDDIDYHKLF